MANYESDSTPGGGARLRWWQETGKTNSAQPWYRSTPPVRVQPTGTPPAVVTPAATAPVETVQAAPLDIGEELELEAKRRAHAEATGARVVVPFDRVKYMRRARRSFLWAAIPQVISILVLVQAAIVLHSAAPLASVGVSAVMIGLMWMMLVQQKATAPQGPALILTDQGLDLGPVGTIYWHEIAEIKKYKVMRQSTIAIVPRDSVALAERLKANRPTTYTVKTRRGLVRRKRKDGPTPTLYLVNHLGAGLSPDEMLARINRFRMVRGV